MAEDMELQIKIMGEDDTGGSFGSLENAFSNLQRLAEDVSRSFDDFARNISSSFSDAGKAADEVTNGLREISTGAETTQKSLEDMLRPLFDHQAESAANEIAKGIENIGVAAEETTKKIETMDEAAKKPAKPGGDGKGKKKEGGLFSMQGQMDSMYAGMAMGAMAAPLDAGLGASIKNFADFDSAMRQVNQEMNLSQTGFGNLEQAIMSLSNTTGISSQDLANGLYNVVATGVTNTADALTLLKTSAEGAKAGNVDLNTTTKAMNAVMGAYGMNASNAGHIMDVMFTAVNNGQMHFKDLASSVGASATSAASAGVSYEELAAAQATLTNVGKNAESASQNLNSLIMGMIAPTSGATKEAKALGIQWDAQALKAHGLSYMINEAMKATHGNSEELKKLLPNQRAYMAVLALGSNAHKQYTDTLLKMKDANGATEEALKQTEQGAGESIDKMKASLTNAGMELVKGLAPALSVVADKVQQLATWFGNLNPNTQKLIGEIVLGAAAFLTLGSAFFMTISGIGALVKGFESLAGALKVVTGAETLMEALSPIGWVILITAAVVAVGVLIYQHWGQIKAFLTQTWNAITSTAVQVWNGITSFFKQWGVTLLAVFVPVIGLPVMIAQHWSQITSFAQQIWSSVVSLIQNIWNGAISWITTEAQNFVNIIVTAFQWMYNHNYYFQDLVDFIKKMWNIAVQDAQAIWSNISSFLQKTWSNLVSVGQSTWSNLVNFLSKIWQSAVNSARSIWSSLTSFFSNLWSSISSAVSNFMNSIVSTLTTKTNQAISAVKGPFQSLGSFFQGLWGQAEQWGENLINMIGQGIRNAAGAVKDAVVNVAHSIASVLGFHSPAREGPAGKGESDQWMNNMLTMFANDIKKNSPKVKAAVNQVALGIKTGLTMPLSQSMVNHMAIPSASNAVGGVVIQVYASGNITRNERELGDIVSRAILDKTKMQGKI